MSAKYALIIGNTEYTDPGLAQLTAPGKDAEDFARVLRDKEISAFDEVNVLLNQPEYVVREAIDDFYNQKMPDDLLVLYFSGHGVRDELGALYLAVKNTIRTKLRATGIKSDYIREAMDQSRSKRQVLILDCCNSGAFAHGTKAATGVSIGTASAFEAGYGRIILTASDSTQYAWEGDSVIGETDNSLFTHFLVEGLEGEADLDSDGRITVDELYDYAYEKVKQATPKQTPSKFSTKQQGEILLRQITRIEDIKPLSLSDQLLGEIENPYPEVRLRAVDQLIKILNGRNLGLARSARATLEKIAAEDDSRRVAQSATQALEVFRQVEEKAEQERKAKEEAEAERKAKEEAEKLARAQAEREAMRLKAEREAAEKAAKEAAENAAREKAEKELADREAARLAAEREAAQEKEEHEAAELAARKKAAREQAEKAESEALELAARRKAEREAKEKVAVKESKVPRPAWLMPSIVGIALVTLLLCGYGSTKLYSTMFGGGGAALPTQTLATEAPAIQNIATEASPAVPAIPTVCAPVNPSFNPQTVDANGKTITIAYEQEPDTLTSEYSSFAFSSWTDQIIGAGLAKWNDKNEFIPEFATEIPSFDNGGISADSLTITWHLKPCIFWSDGQPITSRDIAFTWKSQIDPSNDPISRDGWNRISNIDTPDDYTAVLHFSEVYAPWPKLFTIGPNNAGQILPAHLLEGKTGLEKNPEIHQPTVSGGPFVIKEWIAGDHLTLVANPNYYQGHPKLDQIIIKFVPDPETGLAALKLGDVDLMVNLAESDITAVQALEPSQHLRVDPTSDIEHLFFNLGTIAGVNGDGVSDVDGFCPFHDVRVRKAIILGIDRLSFIKNYLKESGVAFTDSIWPNSPWYNNNLATYSYDPTQADQLLDEAGYPVGSDGIRTGNCNGTFVKFSLGIETTTAQRRVDNVLAIQSDLKKIGIEIRPNHIPAGTFFGSYADGADMPLGKFDMAIFTNGYYPDPDLTSNWDCKDVPNRNNPNGANDYHLCDPRLDEMFARGTASADISTRKQIYDEIQRYIYDNVLVVPLYARANVYGYSDRFIFPPSSSYGGWAWDAYDFDVK